MIIVDIHESCANKVSKVAEHNAMYDFIYNNVDITEGRIKMTDENRLRANFELSNGYVVNFQKGLDTNNTPFYRIEIEDATGDIIHTKKSKAIGSVISSGWSTLTESILAYAFEIIDTETI